MDKFPIHLAMLTVYNGAKWLEADDRVYEDTSTAMERL